jgi:hypothetical protein
MMTGEQKSKALELKAEIAKTAGLLCGAPIEVREAVVELKGQLQRDGTTARELAAVLGVHESTLCRWERDVRAQGPQKRHARSVQSVSPRAASSFRMVTVTTPEARPAELAPASMPSAGSLRVAHAPSGLVVDGLDVESLAALLRRMA